MNHRHFTPFIGSLLLCALGAQQAQAAIALDRTRVVFEAGQKSVSLSVSNENKQLPYLAQGWLEDANGKKVNSPLVVLPPLQRIEPGAKSQLKVQSLPAVAQLPQDRESLFYFNLREIPRAATSPTPCRSPCKPVSSCSTGPRPWSRPEASRPPPGRSSSPSPVKATATG